MFSQKDQHRNDINTPGLGEGVGSNGGRSGGVTWIVISLGLVSAVFFQNFLGDSKERASHVLLVWGVLICLIGPLMAGRAFWATALSLPVWLVGLFLLSQPLSQGFALGYSPGFFQSAIVLLGLLLLCWQKGQTGRRLAWHPRLLMFLTLLLAWADYLRLETMGGTWPVGSLGVALPLSPLTLLPLAQASDNWLPASYWTAMGLFLAAKVIILIPRQIVNKSSTAGCA